MEALTKLFMFSGLRKRGLYIRESREACDKLAMLRDVATRRCEWGGGGGGGDRRALIYQVIFVRGSKYLV